MKTECAMYAKNLDSTALADEYRGEIDKERINNKLSLIRFEVGSMFTDPRYIMWDTNLAVLNGKIGVLEKLVADSVVVMQISKNIKEDIELRLKPLDKSIKDAERKMVSSLRAYEITLVSRRARREGRKLANAKKNAMKRRCELDECGSNHRKYRKCAKKLRKAERKLSNLTRAYRNRAWYRAKRGIDDAEKVLDNRQERDALWTEYNKMIVRHNTHNAQVSKYTSELERIDIERNQCIEDSWVTAQCKWLEKKKKEMDELNALPADYLTDDAKERLGMLCRGVIAGKHCRERLPHFKEQLKIAEDTLLAMRRDPSIVMSPFAMRIAQRIIRKREPRVHCKNERHSHTKTEMKQCSECHHMCCIYEFGLHNYKKNFAKRKCEACRLSSS